MKLHPVLIGELLRRQGADVLYLAVARDGYQDFCPMAAFVHQAKALAS